MIRFRIKNGWTRLAIVFAVVSIVFWGALLSKAAYDARKAEHSFHVISDIYDYEIQKTGDVKKELADDLDASGTAMWRARSWLQLCAMLAIAGFIIPPIFVAATVWIHRGFKNSN